FVRLTVTDTGHGMDDATLERVFEPFFTTKSDGGGTGLGLATVHGIVKNHGGTITVYSEPGRGTTFRVYFPALGPEVKSAEQAAATIAIPKGNGEHVLLVDDEESLMILGRNMLERLGYRVTACCRVVEALSTFSAQPNAFDLIVTDQTMPVLTGLLLIQELRKLRPDIPAILCTGFSKVTTPEAAASAGISEILRKPISLASLAQAVHKALAQHRANSRA
ncbi:MAG: response regulator, partial [Candidatus Hydrogenedentes bacterium]|nr:response regulator [Candidatus Hydrogenedentota bacterium]